MARFEAKSSCSCVQVRAGSSFGSDGIIIFFLAAAALAVLGKDIHRGALLDADSAAHVMDGVLIHDWIMAGPREWRSPMQFAERQYGHYPTLGIGQHYPPGFAVIEAVFFAVFGVSGASARLCVAFFGVLCATGAFIFVRFFADRWTAMLCGLLTIALPATTHWGRQAMLEVPTLAALIWSGVAFAWYLRQRTTGRFLLMVIAAACTIFFKQTGVFLLCSVAAALTWSAWAGAGRWSHAAVAVVMGFAALGAMLWSLDDLCLKTVSGYDTFSDRWGWRALAFYVRTMPQQTGWVIPIVAIVGLVSVLRKPNDHQRFLLAWIVISYIMVTVASLKTPRFFYVGLFPIVVWAAVAVGCCLRAMPFVRWRAASASIIAGFLALKSFARPVPEGPDFGAMVELNRNRIENRAVLFSGLRDGDFVFAVREQIPWRKAVVIRGSKLFYTCTAGPDLDLVPMSNSAAELAETMQRFAFDTVFVERDNRVGTPQDDWLREYLAHGDDYERVESHVVQLASNRCGADLWVDVYRLKRDWSRKVDHFDISIPRTRSTIRIELPNVHAGERPS